MTYCQISLEFSCATLSLQRFTKDPGKIKALISSAVNPVYPNSIPHRQLPRKPLTWPWAAY